MGAADRGEYRQAAGAVAQGVRKGLDGHTVLGISVMAKADTRDAKTMMAEIKAEFRRALKATRKFQAFFTAERDHTRRAAEWIHGFGEWATESEPFAASYRRISSEFPDQMDRLHKLLLPIYREFEVRKED
jgi:hypothetical protein